MQAFSAGAVGTMPTMASSSPSASSSTTDTEATFSSQLQTATDRQAAANHSSDSQDTSSSTMETDDTAGGSVAAGSADSSPAAEDAAPSDQEQGEEQDDATSGQTDVLLTMVSPLEISLANRTDTGTMQLSDADSASGSVVEEAAEGSGETMVSNGYGQTIVVQLGTEAQDVAASSGSSGNSRSSALTTETSIPMDFTNQYMHARLSENSALSQSEETSDTPATTTHHSPNLTNGTLQQGQAQTAAEQWVTELVNMSMGTGQENQSFLFSQYQGSTQTQTEAGITTATTDTSLYRLPSGLSVSDGTVVDQVIAQFSVNKRLETGSVNLRLYPQELGELRMEIEVKQDNIKAHIVTQSPHAQEMIDRHMPRLREALEQQGLHLQEIEVTVAANGNASEEGSQRSNTWQQSGKSPSSESDQAVFSLTWEEESPDAAQASTSLSVIA